jgi:2-keto-4-pentenoate hydratase/2-oxohepta-3-ene-1,7-dioic acid hydratase in catechol pathway
VKIVLFGPERRIGAWQNDKVIDLNRALANYLRDQRGETNAQAHADEKIPPRLERFIALGKAAIEDAQRAVEHATKYGADAVVHDAKSVKFHAPWPERRIACVGGNYAAHLAGMWAGRPGVTGDLAQITQLAREEGQWGFWKNPHEVAGPDEEIPYPKRTRRFDYEGELAIVIGKRGKDILADRIDEYVWGSPCSTIGVSATAGQVALKGDPSVTIWQRTSTAPPPWGLVSWSASSITAMSMWRHGSTAKCDKIITPKK